jgi:hypothetical protein
MNPMPTKLSYSQVLLYIKKALIAQGFVSGSRLELPTFGL